MANQNPTEEKPKHQWQIIKEGWYSKLNVTVKQLDIIIVVSVIALVLVLAHGYINRGYTVEFDSLGGTPVASQKLMYGDLVEEPEPPTREGFVFAGWYRDILLEQEWNMQTDTVETNMKLYARWEEKSE